MSELPSPMVFASHSPVFEEEALSVFYFKQKIFKILDNAGNIELVDKMIFEAMKEAVLTESSGTELENFFGDG